MSVQTLLPVEEYLNTSYSPDREYRDGTLVERNVGDKAHAMLQIALGSYVHRRRKQWKVYAYTELRVKVRDTWYPIPDLCIYSLPEFEGRYPSRPPLLWIEILSHDDRMVDVWTKPMNWYRTASLMFGSSIQTHWKASYVPPPALRLSRTRRSGFRIPQS